MRAIPHVAHEYDTQKQAQRRDQICYVTLRVLACPEGRNLWERQILGVWRSLFTSGIAASIESLRHQESIRRDGESLATPPT